jgi:hypothetical protein
MIFFFLPSPTSAMFGQFMARLAFTRGTYGKDTGTGETGSRRDQRRLEERRRKLEEKEREQAIATIEKSGLLKLEPKRLADLTARIKTLGFEEVERLKA